jgi:hypothetical protein
MIFPAPKFHNDDASAANRLSMPLFEHRFAADPRAVAESPQSRLFSHCGKISVVRAAPRI